MVQKIKQRHILESVPILPAKVTLSVAVGRSELAMRIPNGSGESFQNVPGGFYISLGESSLQMFNLPGR